MLLTSNPVRGVVHPKIWIRPTGNYDFKVTQNFGCTGFIRERPLGSCAHFHRGIDLSNRKCGSDVLAAQAGTVHQAGKDPYDGAIYVMINHGSGWFTTYWHLSKEIVYKGQKVTSGQKIGEIGSTGNSTGCHLHFTLKSGVSATTNILKDSNGTWEDPWTHLMQNVTVRPTGAGVNIRATAGSGTTLGANFAKCGVDGDIHRVSDNANLGAISQARKYGGSVTGASYTGPDGKSSNVWYQMALDGAWRFIAAPYAIRSES